MKEFWVEIEDSLPDKTKNSLLETAKGNCHVVLTGKNSVSAAKSLGLKTASTTESDIQVLDSLTDIAAGKLMEGGKPVCLKMAVKDRVDEEKVVEASSKGADYILVSCPDWKVIPLENLIARVRGRSKLLAEVSSVEEAKLALETLELGVDGVVLKTDKAKEIKTLAPIMKKTEGLAGRLKLAEAKVVACKQLGSGARVCVDTCDLMDKGEGILVGCQSIGLFLVQAEVEENPHVEPRPFRVNAGTVSLYVLAAGDKTRYLSELKAGDEVSIVARDGSVRAATVGRVKMERRPLMLVEAEVEGKRIKTIVQNAETVSLVTGDGAKPVRELKKGDRVIVYHQPGGRHFGVLVKEETVLER